VLDRDRGHRAARAPGALIGIAGTVRLVIVGGRRAAIALLVIASWFWLLLLAPPSSTRSAEEQVAEIAPSCPPVTVAILRRRVDPLDTHVHASSRAMIGLDRICDIKIPGVVRT